MNKEDILNISNLTLEEVFHHFKTSNLGLNSDEIEKRHFLYGYNIIQNNKNFNFGKQFIKQFISMFAILLWISSVLAFFIGDTTIGIAIVSVVVINGIFSFFQEYKADKILSSLNDMMPKKIQVYRDNKIQMIDITDLTIGDLIFLEMGTIIPADARLVEANNFFVDNSMLSGETVPLNKNSFPNLEKINVISEIPNLVYAGTTVSRGSAKAIVYSIGSKTQIGEVSDIAQNIKKRKSTLEKEINRIVKKISCIASFLSIVVFLICFYYYYNDKSYLSNFTKALKSAVIVALGMLVANIPEGLLPTINLSLAIGSQRMAKRKVLIKKLFSVETLNSTTVICTDKTGTLTKNQLTCKKVLFPGGIFDIEISDFSKQILSTDIKNNINDDKVKVLNKLFIAAIMCSETNLIDDPKDKNYFKIIGNPTEGSLLIAASKYGLDVQQVKNNWKIEKINPFSSENKKMSVLVENISQEYYDKKDKYLFIKGAPNILLEDCLFQYKNKKVLLFSEEEKKFFEKQNQTLSTQGYRLLAIAYKKIEKNISEEENKMVFLGFTVHYDPPKIEVSEAVKKLYQYGLRIVVITGDFGPTVVSIGKQVGIISEENNFLNIDGSQIDKMSTQELREIIKKPQPIFFSRATPKHKLQIVEAYRDNGEVVGFIGDGVNDILAMKSADIGIAMGKSGKDIAINSADMILLDDDFSSIPKAVLEARNIYSNIKKFMIYVFSSNVPQIFPILFMAFTQMPLYLGVMQILAIDLVTDLLPAIALGGEKPEDNLSEQKPINNKDSLLDKTVLKKSYGFLGIIEGLLALIFFLCYIKGDIKKFSGWNFEEVTNNKEFLKASTMAFGAVIFAQIGNVFACRSNRLYFWKVIFKKNKLLYFGILCELFFFILVSQSFDKLNNFFGNTKIDFSDYLYLSCCTLVILLFDTIYKFFVNNKFNKKRF
ncbi:cation-translocating P-type ATPase [Candidatus Phytoplasma pini]|uniref:P-type ATPase n=1 Tax=Candidatus Phytoplasma pini TaxID=267362 RepID=A0A559KJH1_9MOLU|nr:cation-transporting P-type ATPase [Candidatus Phytoplasma pini]TVY12283.1 P-type ATPase [Candidatus Phytoplasma pini]